MKKIFYFDSISDFDININLSLATFKSDNELCILIGDGFHKKIIFCFSLKIEPIA